MELIKRIQLLKQKALAVLITSLASVSHINAKDLKISEIDKDLKKSDEEIKKDLKPKLVLKLNFALNGIHAASMHVSHSSHSSHSSHYSSSYSGSSSSSYTPSNTPSYTPQSTYYPPANSETPIPKTPKTIYRSSGNSSHKIKKANTKQHYNPSTNTLYSTENPAFDSYYLGVRVLYKGLEGNDVEELQIKLKKLGYDVVISTYFGEKTRQAVIKFQQNNGLKPDGRVGKKTMEIIESRL